MSYSQLITAITDLNPIRLYYEAAGVSLQTDNGINGEDLTHANSPATGQAGPITGLLSVDYSGATDMITSSAGGEIAMNNTQSFLVIAKSSSATNPGAVEYIASGQDTDANNRWAISYLTDGTLRFAHEVAGDDLSWDTTADTYDGNWHMYGFGASNATNDAVGYVDGVLNGAAGTLPLAATNGFAIGGRAASLLPFTGSVALVAVFNTYLTTEFADIYTAYTADDPTGLPGPLRSHLRRRRAG